MRRYLHLAAAVLTAPVLLGGCSAIGELISGGMAAEAPTLPDIAEITQKYDDSGFMALQTDAERRLYACIDATVQKPESERFATEPLEDPGSISDVIEFYRDDHPEMFWIDETTPYYYAENKGTLFVELNFKLSGSGLSAAKAELEDKLDAVVKAAPQNVSAYELELYAHDYLVDNCEYDSEALEVHKTEQVRANEQNVYGALVDRKAVCEGYARAFQLVCRRLGINCGVIQGQAKGFEGQELVNHIWNCVELDGSWYQTDVTWDDSENGNITRFERYLYFNLTSAEIAKDHITAPPYSEYTTDEVWYNGFVPECTATEYCWYLKNTMPLDNTESDAFAEPLAKAAAEGKDDFGFVVAEELDFEKAFDDVVQGSAYRWISAANDINGGNYALGGSCTVISNETRRLIVLLLDYE